MAKRKTHFDREELKQATLDWCNKMRVEQGKEPLSELPKGRRGDGASCPCGAATGLNVGRFYWTEGGPGAKIIVREDNNQLPVAVQLFVAKFDDGQFPELDSNIFAP